MTLPSPLDALFHSYVEKALLTNFSLLPHQREKDVSEVIPMSTAPVRISVSDVLGMPPLITPSEAAGIVRMSEGHIRDLMRDGAFPAVKMGRRWRVPLIDFLEWAHLSPLAAEMQQARPTRAERRRYEELQSHYSVDLSSILGGPR